TKSFLQKKDTEIAQELVRTINGEVRQMAPGLKVELDPQDAARNLRTEQPVPYLVMDNKPPILFLMERARRIGYELSLEESHDKQSKVTVHFSPTSYVSQPVRLLEWGISLIGFQPTLHTARQVSEVTVLGWDPKNKAKFEGKATRSDLGDEK